MKKLIFTILLFNHLFLSTVCFSKTENVKGSYGEVFNLAKADLQQNPEKIIPIFNLIYNTRFKEAEKLLGEADFQGEPFYFQVLKLDLFWWKYSISKSEPNEEKLNNVLNWFSEQNKNSKYSEINKLIWLSYKMRFEVKRKNYIKAFLLKAEVTDQLEVVQKNPVPLPDNQQKLLDVFTFLSQYSNEAGSVFGNNSKKQVFLNALQKLAADSDWVVSSEAHYFLGRIYTKIEKEPEKGRIHFQTLSLRFPQNRLFESLAAGNATDF